MTALRTQCLPIQGGGSPMSGRRPVAEHLGPSQHAPLEFELKRTPAFYWNEVTNHYSLSNKKHRNGTITGKLRNVYEFLVPKYPIGTFVIYSCLGEGHTSRPSRSLSARKAAAPNLPGRPLRSRS